MPPPNGSRLERWKGTITGGVLVLAAGMVTFSNNGVSLWDRFTHRAPWAPEFEPKLEEIVRDIQSQVPSPVRMDRLRARANRFAKDYKLESQQVKERAEEVMRRFELAAVSRERGFAYFSRSKFGDARREFESSLTMDPGSAETWSNLGAVEMQVGDIGAARASYDRAMALRPNDEKLRYNFALFFARTGDPDEAMRQLRIAMPDLRSKHGADLVAAVCNELSTDPGLAALRARPGFSALLAP